MSRSGPLVSRLVQLDVAPAHPTANTERILSHIAAAISDGVDLVVFPEMAIPGYLIGDEWEFPSFLRECERCADRVISAARGVCVIFGSVGLDWTRHNEDGRVRKYNACFIAENGRLAAPEGFPYPFVIKTLTPNYREFDESRHFYDLRKLAVDLGASPESLLKPVRAAGVALGCLLCEDGWDIDYSISPLRILVERGAELLIDISASPFTRNKNHKRNRVFAAQARTLQRPLLYVNQVSLQNNGKTVYAFDGGSCVYDARGRRRSIERRFAQETLTVELPLDGAGGAGYDETPPEDGIGVVREALAFGASRFLGQASIERVVIGVSGGIDSAVAAALYGSILDPERLLLVNMPSRFSSPTTRALAKGLAAALGCLYAELSIEESVARTVGQVDGIAVATVDGRNRRALRLSPFHCENVQARDRGARLLSALASAFGGAFTCNANKAELTVGYSTLYGDLGGFLALLGDLWKGDVYELGRNLNEAVYGREIIPEGSFTVAPSAELSAAQDVDAALGDPLTYPYHDRLFASWIERWNRLAPEDILEAYRNGTLPSVIGYAGRLDELFPTHQAFVEDLERWWNLYQGLGVAKRIQAPPVMAVTRRAFGFDHREAQMRPRYTERYGQLKAELLRDSLKRA